MVAVLYTKLDPFGLLDEIFAIERLIGRKRGKARYASRTIDIDILFYDQLIINTPRLTIPHPCLESRLFVLIPLLEAAPDFNHPVTGLSAKAMLENCPDNKEVAYYGKPKLLF